MKLLPNRNPDGRRVRHVRIYSKLTMSRLYGVVILHLLVLLHLANGTNDFYSCPPTRQVTYMSIPKDVNCSLADTSTPQIRRTAVYQRSFAEIPGFYCSMITREVCTRTFFRITLSVVRDITYISNVSISDCIVMNVTKNINGDRLEKIGTHRWRTRHPTEYSYGWFGTRCQKTVNYIFEDGVLQLHDEIGRAAGCNVSSGQCIKAHETIVWDSSSVSHLCPFKLITCDETQIYTDHITVVSLQSIFIPIHTIKARHLPFVKNCNFSAPQLMQNGFLIDFGADLNNSCGVKRTVKNAKINDIRSLAVQDVVQPIDDDDPINAKLQFLYEIAKEKEIRNMRWSWQKFCKLHNFVQSTVIWLGQLNPTAAVRLLLARNDVKATRMGDLFRVTPCHRVKPDKIYTNHRVGDRCFEDLPIITGDHLMFVDAISKEVKLTSKQLNCESLTLQPFMKSSMIGIESEAVPNDDKKVIFNGRKISSLKEDHFLRKLDEIQELLNNRDENIDYDMLENENRFQGITDEAEHLTAELIHDIDRVNGFIQKGLDEVSTRMRYTATGIITFLLVLSIPYGLIKLKFWKILCGNKRTKPEDHSFKWRFPDEQRQEKCTKSLLSDAKSEDFQGITLRFT
ncbi:hypothetical protein AB6A40_000049 [Gnathostoma spinigerum]|uniref:Glycoprotein n=1 Tax=Gnathostoma spinigerum TaxID=75299 RepID=A0ABD6E1A8_9BILA